MQCICGIKISLDVLVNRKKYYLKRLLSEIIFFLKFETSVLIGWLIYT